MGGTALGNDEKVMKFMRCFQKVLRCVSDVYQTITVHCSSRTLIAASAFHQESLPLLPSGKVDRRALKFGVLALSLLSLKGPDPSGCNATIPFAKTESHDTWQSLSTI